MHKAPVGISITTYEDNNGVWQPVITHTFWGNTFSEALGNAEAHLLTDYFFSSSFVGEMEWGEGLLYLRNEDEIIGEERLRRGDRVEYALAKLERKASEIDAKKREVGLIEIIESLREGDSKSYSSTYGGGYRY